jgi:hypothetical protein
MASSRHSAAFMVNLRASAVRPPSCALRARAKKRAAWLRNLFVGMTLALRSALSNFGWLIAVTSRLRRHFFNQPHSPQPCRAIDRHCTSGALIHAAQSKALPVRGRGFINAPRLRHRRLSDNTVANPRKKLIAAKRHLLPELDPLSPARAGAVVRSGTIFFHHR